MAPKTMRGYHDEVGHWVPDDHDDDDIDERIGMLLSRMMKHAPLSSISQGGEKRRGGMAPI